MGRPARHAGQHAVLARRARSYDYRSFFKLLLVIILAVMGAAAGEIVFSLFGLPNLVGSLGMIVRVLTIGLWRLLRS